MTDDEITSSMQREIARLADDVARLRAGLDAICGPDEKVTWHQRIAVAVLGGADIRDPGTQKAIALGRWKPTPTPDQRGR